MDPSLIQGVTLFYMELISNMCFGLSPPEKSVLNALTETTLSPKSSEFSLDVQSIPALQVYLFQQLFKYRYAI